MLININTFSGLSKAQGWENVQKVYAGVREMRLRKPFLEKVINLKTF